MTPMLKKAHDAPEEPGVYLMRDRAEHVIYVGKAKNLKSRLKSYFTSIKNHSEKTKKLVEKIVDFSYIILQSEIEALLLERHLIRQYDPIYNIIFRDDKEYPYVRISIGEQWPRITKVRKKIESDGCLYLGPFPSGKDLSQSLELIKRVFPIIRCSPHEFKNRSRPCHYYHMKKCLGPCTEPVDPEFYRKMIGDIIGFLKGENKEVTQSIEMRMKEAAAADRFEIAALYRDELASLKNIVREGDQNVITDTIENAHVFGLAFFEEKAQISVLEIINQRITTCENILLEMPLGNFSLESFLLQFYESREVPGMIILPSEVEEALAGALGAKVHLITPMRGEKKDVLMIANKNASEQLRLVLDTEERGINQLKELAAFLKVEHPLRRIECMDVSNFGATSIYVSSVVFIDGKKSSDDYRVFKIEGLSAPDDFTSIHEGVRRRLAQSVKDETIPDLLVIDGGAQQLAKAVEARDELGMSVPLVSLAKRRVINSEGDPLHSRERVFLEDRKTPLPLEIGSVPFRILTSIRDEAHRFALSHHRKGRTRGAMRSPLDEIRNVGPKTRARLLTSFGSVSAVLAASSEDLLARGFSQKVANSLLDFRRSQDSSSEV